MRTLLTLILTGLLIAGCSPAAHAPLPVQPAATDKSWVGNRGIASVATEGPFLSMVPPNEATSVSTPPGLGANGSPIPLEPIQGNSVSPAAATTTPISTSGWKTFTITSYRAAVDYPPDWSVADQADGAVFTSPGGATIQLKLVRASGGDDFLQGNQRCIFRTNPYGLTASFCVVGGSSFNDGAAFTLKMSDGSMEVLGLSTTARDTVEVFDAMANSVRLIH
jgi:hypothetical protein